MSTRILLRPQTAAAIAPKIRLIYSEGSWFEVWRGTVCIVHTTRATLGRKRGNHKVEVLTYKVCNTTDIAPQGTVTGINGYLVRTSSGLGARSSS